MPLLPDCVRRIETDDGMRLVFPWREVPRPLLAQIRIYYGLAIGGAAVALLLLALALLQPPDDLTANALGGSAVFGLLALAALSYAVSLSWTRSIIEYSRNGLRLIEQVGLSRRRRKRLWSNVESIRTHHLIHGTEKLDEPPTIGTLEVAGRGAQSLWVAHDYPRDWLLAAGAEIASMGRVEHEEVPFDTPTVRVRAFLASDVEDLDTIDLPEQPADSRAVAERRPEGLTIAVPPTAGEWVASAARAGLFVGVIALLGTIGLAAGNPPPGGAAEYLPMALFISVGALMMSAGYLAAHRMTVIVIDDRMLCAVTKAPLGFTQRHAVFRGEIRAVRSEFDAHEGKQALGHSLCLELASGKRRILVWRTHDEVRWLATVVRTELGVPAVVVRTVAS